MSQKVCNERGLTLIEVLVALALLSLAAFALSMSGIESLRLAQGSLYRALAASHAGDLVRMQSALLRVHPELISYIGVDPGPPHGYREQCFEGACGPSDLMQHFVASWKCSLGFEESCGFGPDMQGLPSFDARLEVDSAAESLNLIVEWRERGREQTLQLRGELR